MCSLPTEDLELEYINWALKSFGGKDTEKSQRKRQDEKLHNSDWLGKPSKKGKV